MSAAANSSYIARHIGTDAAYALTHPIFQQKRKHQNPIRLAALFALAACNNNVQSGGGAAGTVSNPAASAKETPAAAAGKLQTKFVTIATDGVSDLYNIIGTSPAEAYAKEFSVNSKTQTIGASLENINLINQIKSEMVSV